MVTGATSAGVPIPVRLEIDAPVVAPEKAPVVAPGTGIPTVPIEIGAPMVGVEPAISDKRGAAARPATGSPACATVDEPGARSCQPSTAEPASSATAPSATAAPPIQPRMAARAPRCDVLA